MANPRANQNYLCRNTFDMATANFYLKSPNPSGESLIYLQFKYKGRKFVYSTGQFIRPANWNPERQRVKNTKATTSSGDALINDVLEALAKKVESTYKGSVEVPTNDAFRAVLDEFRTLNDEPTQEPDRVTLFGLVERFVGNEILNRGKERNPNTIKSYVSTKNHLEGFQKSTKYRVDFDTINLDFYYQFVSYLKKKGLSANTIGKYLKNVKTFMREAVDMELTDNLQFAKKKFSILKEETQAVYLKESEIILLYNLDLSGKPRLQQVRDLFVFGCFVGLRFSDFSDVRPENIIDIEGELYLRVKTKKMGNRVTIPCNPIVRDIFSTYEAMPNKLPRAISNQKFNQYIKEVCRLAGLIQTGRLEGSPSVELWECVSSHTARRSFATNLYNEGFPILDIMKITGHKTERAFLQYIKITDEDAAVKLNEHNKRKDWSKILLRVAS
jgi:integrase